MAPRQKVPSKDVLRRWRDEGLTQQEMVHRVLAESGEEVSRSAIANAMTRYGLAEDGARYPQEVPWSVNAMHATANPLRMLRLLGRRVDAGRMPWRRAGAEAALTGAPWSLQTVAAAAEVLSSEGTPIDDQRASAAYRSAMLGQALPRLWHESQDHEEVVSS